MKRLILALLTAIPAVGYSLPAAAQPKPAAPDLPITRIVLFSSGVGFFQREGQIENNAHIDLQFPVADVNDLLKSLTLEDRGGGKISPVSYDNRNPLEMTLKSFAIDLTQNPSLAELLNQARGEKVEITLPDERQPANAPHTLSGMIVGVEKQKQPVGKDQVIEVAQLNLLTDDGLQGVPLAKVQRVHFAKPSLDQEFRKALAVLATGHDKQKKSVTLQFAGQGKRPVRVGYVTESPIWKTSYRMDLGQDKIGLQGWAIVENTSDEDWKNVRLGLVSGRPISFKMDLYEPLFVQRPVVEPELFASLRPPSYQGNLQAQVAPPGGGAGGEKATFKSRRAMPVMKSAPARSADGAGKGSLLLEGRNGKDGLGLSLDDAAGVASMADAKELGEFFQYAIQQPVSLARQKSALIPIVNQDVSGTRVSIYNEGVQPKFPLLGLRFRNQTGLHLSQGPITVFEENSYAGDARIPDLQPGETRLLSYAVDLGVEVEPQHKAADSMMAVKIFKGVLHATHKLRETKTYTIKDRSDRPRTVLVEHPFRTDYQLVSPKEPAERSRDVYRFEVAVQPQKPATLTVIEDQPRVEQIILTNMDDEGVRFYVRHTASSTAVKQALEQALTLKSQVNAAHAELQKEEQALKVIEADQSRMRANMERLPQTSEVYKRYLKKFDEQETEVEKRRERITQLQATAEKHRKAYEEFLAGLTVE